MSTDIFRTVASEAEARLEEKRSVFIAAVRRVATEEEAAAFVRERKKMHADARHNVWAYLLRSGAARYSDDAEPTGTAGMPTLEAIRRAGVEDVCVVTTRYFGGILLGAGGLTRAYANAATDGLAAAGTLAFEPFFTYRLSCSYADYQRVESECQRAGVLVDGTDFTDLVTVNVALPAPAADDFCTRITELTAGRTACHKTGERMDVSPNKE